MKLYVNSSNNQYRIFSLVVILTLINHNATAREVDYSIILTNMPLKEFLLAALGIISSILLIRIQYQKNRIQEIERQLSAKKFELYSEFIYLIFDIMFEEKTGKKAKTKEQLFSIKRNMFLYATDEIFLAFTDWLNSLNDPKQHGVGSTSHFIKFYKILELIRKEMVDKNTKISLDDFMLFVMQNKTEYEKFKEVNNW